MNFITINEAATKWNLSIRRVQDLCKAGRISGAKKFGTNWMIPSDASRPLDRRTVCGKVNKNSSTFYSPLRQTPFLDMTDIYNTPGTADEIASSLCSSPEAQALFAAEIAYSRGEINKVYEHANYFLSRKQNLYTSVAASMLLALVAMWKGDVHLWNKSKKCLYETPWETQNDREILLLSIAATDLSIRNTRDFPDWFYRGRFEHLPSDAHPAARVYYIKYLLIFAQELANGKLHLDDVQGLGLMRSLPFIIEPLIAQSVAERTIMAEIYLRLLCSIAYHQTGDVSNASHHLDKAILLCLPDRLYGPLVEHRRQLGLFLDERLMLINPHASRRVKELHKQLHEGWVTLHNTVMNKHLSVKLSDREREVVRLAAFGLGDVAIATQLGITKSSVKSMLQMARNKTGIKDRSDFGIYI